MVKKKFKRKSAGEDKKKIKPKALYSETKKGILAIVSFTLAILSLLSFFNGAGFLGQYFLRISKLFFGSGFFLVPVVFVLVGLAIIMPRFNLSGRKRPAYKTIFIGIVFFVLSILGIFHTFNYKGGGYLGLLIGYPLMSFLGFWASLLILLALLIISILVIFNIPLIPVKKEVPPAEPSRIPDIKDVGKKEYIEDKPVAGFWNKIKSKAEKGIKKVKKKKSEDHFLNQEAPVDQSKAKIAPNKGVKLVTNFKLPPLDFLEKDKGKPTSGDIKANINVIKGTLENFGIEVEMSEVNVGPTVTQYTLRPAQGVKLSKITGLQNDIALALAAHPIRIEAPIPGRSLVGIEIPNRLAVVVRLRNLLERPAFQEASSLLTFSLGRDVAGNPAFANLAQMPHLLVAGATGTGKTVALNNLIISLLYRNSPEDLKFIFIDPKRVELSTYNGIPHLLTPVIIQPDKAAGALNWAVGEMERRFGVLHEAGKRDLDSYNQYCLKNTQEQKLPYIVIVIDELADLMASHGREVEGSIVRLAQMSRAVGIHLIVSTQRPSVEVITGLIKANITSRIAFQAASQIDSRTILDMAGAEKLLGNGDLLFLSGSATKPRRLQGAYVNDKEVKKVTDYLRGIREPDYKDEITSVQSIHGRGVSMAGNPDGVLAEDELYEEAKEVVVRAGKASASLLQRRLRVGYARAARLLDILEERGVVGQADGAKPREVFIDEGAEQEF